MRLYSYQGVDIFSRLMATGIYFADYEHKNGCFEGHKCMLEPYQWLMDQLNKKIDNDFSSCPIWWYTSLKQVKRELHREVKKVLLIAEVPDDKVLLYHSSLWYGPLNDYALGRNWFDSEIYSREASDKYWNLYKKNPEAKYETWKEIFRYRKEDREWLHAVTPYIDLAWLTR